MFWFYSQQFSKIKCFYTERLYQCISTYLLLINRLNKLFAEYLFFVLGKNFINSQLTTSSHYKCFLIYKDFQIDIFWFRLFLALVILFAKHLFCQRFIEPELFSLQYTTKNTMQNTTTSTLTSFLNFKIQIYNHMLYINFSNTFRDIVSLATFLALFK